MAQAARARPDYIGVVARAGAVTVSWFLFILLSALTLGGALGVVVTSNVVHAALALLVSLLAVAGFYLILFAEFLASLRSTDGLYLKRMRRAFGNDVLLAVACREAGITLVTDNEGDFERIGRHVDFDFVKPWPGPSK